MGNCRLSDPKVLAHWLDGTLDPDEVREIDRHLLGGCAVCWSVLRFVGRLRELVGRRDSGDRRAVEARILLDSEAIRAAIGIGGRHVDHREILIEMGPLEALVKISDTRGPHPCRLDMLAMDRAALGPPAGPIALELCRNAEVVARGRTGPDGRLSLPIKTRGAFRLMFQGAGLRRTDVRIEI